MLFLNQTEYGNARFLRTNVLSARPDLKKYTALRFRQEVKRHPEPGEDGPELVLVFLEAYRALDPAGQKQLLAEVAALGQRGLAINDPDQKHQLRHYRGGSTVSALQVACLYYAGVKLLLPGQDPGLDLGREYGLARGVVGEG